MPFFAPVHGDLEVKKGTPSGSEAHLSVACCESVSRDGSAGFMCETMGRVGEDIYICVCVCARG